MTNLEHVNISLISIGNFPICLGEKPNCYFHLVLFFPKIFVQYLLTLIEYNRIQSNMSLHDSSSGRSVEYEIVGDICKVRGESYTTTIKN